MDIKKKIAGLPDSPGVYIMKDAAGKIIYIGKAISLKKRVQSYFRPSRTRDFKRDLLVTQIKDVEYKTVPSEEEALLLEASLIKFHQPKFNVELRDGKSYPLLKISDEDFPCISICRPKKKTGATFFGPYTSAGLLRDALNIIRKVFPFRTCRNLPKKSCLDFHLRLCPGPCVGKISKKDYRKIIDNITLLLEGRQEELYDNLKKAMQQKAAEKNFEEAATLRDQLQSLASLYSASPVKNYLQEAQQLKEALRLTITPERIEALDISHLSAQEAVGSLVSFYKGKPDKNNYRRFRIKEVKGNNDYQMLAEVARRRYSRLKREGASLPDLLVVDGGKGQVSAVKRELDKLRIDLATLGLAKEKEEIFLPQKKNPIMLRADSPALQLLQRLRDEAHRFAQSYHHILRRKRVLGEKN
jgi:excinuclease ABC subunit C